MTVKQFDPKQTTTLETPVKIIEEQSKVNLHANRAAKVGFVSLGCLR
ncbi:hypothetical protein [uncultured Paraglaciecola sp.]|nr:hypothetical protein [uncultured Paraglaciecola sp.]